MFQVRYEGYEDDWFTTEKDAPMAADPTQAWALTQALTQLSTLRTAIIRLRMALRATTDAQPETLARLAQQLATVAQDVQDWTRYLTIHQEEL